MSALLRVHSWRGRRQGQGLVLADHLEVSTVVTDIRSCGVGVRDQTSDILSSMANGIARQIE